MKMRKMSDDVVWLDHDGVIRETADAKLYDLGEEIWLPKSQIIDDDGERVGVPRWVAESKGLEGDYEI